MKKITFELNRTNRFLLGLFFCYLITSCLEIYPWYMAAVKSSVAFPLVFGIKPTLMGFLPACAITYWVPALDSKRLLAVPVISTLCAEAYGAILRPNNMYGPTQIIIIAILFTTIGFFGVLSEVLLSARYKAKKEEVRKTPKVKRYSGPDI